MITIAVERLLNLRRRHLHARGLRTKSHSPCGPTNPRPRLLECCRQHPVHPRADDRLSGRTPGGPETSLLIAGAADIGSPRIAEGAAQNLRPGSVIAAIAPLLGLLGTIIGMVEAFKLVEIYGDEGGATILAGSISKALITTVLGLVIAIPGLALYHFFRLRIQALGKQLDEEMEQLVNAWLLKKPRS
jgi:biopolymer transport protein ExbB